MPHFYKWERNASAKWCDAWEERLRGAVGLDRVSILQAGRLRRLIKITAWNLSRQEALELLSSFGGKFTRQPHVDWVTRTSASKRKIAIRRRLIISDRKPTKKEQESGIPWLTIGASAAFGTGDHATTAMSLRLLADAMPPGGSVLDAGSGSGILALAALRLGALKALGIDNDPLAIRVALDHANQNQLADNVHFRLGTITRTSIGNRRFDWICANLFADLLMQSFPLFRQALRPGGGLIYSGVLFSQEPGVREAATAYGFQIQTVKRTGKWIAAYAVVP